MTQTRMLNGNECDSLTRLAAGGDDEGGDADEEWL
jgi:hypothetical protein